MGEAGCDVGLMECEKRGTGGVLSRVDGLSDLVEGLTDARIVVTHDYRFGDRNTSFPTPTVEPCYERTFSRWLLEKQSRGASWDDGAWWSGYSMKRGGKDKVEALGGQA